jgi:amino acid adenylation domain-containing protein
VSSDGKQRLAALTEEQRQSLARRLSRGKLQPSRGIAPAPRETNTFPLSFAQQRIWFLSQLGPLNTAFNCGSPIRLRGPLDIDVLARTVNEILRRHECLRTTFTSVDGVPVQHVHPFVPQPLEVSDLHHVSKDLRAAEAFRLISEEYRRPWVLETGPLIRTKLWRLSDDDHLLLVVMHHIVSDGWSWGLIESELTTLYRAFITEQPSPLPTLPIQYADFAVWQKDWINSEECRRQLDFWKQQFATLPKAGLVQRDASGPGVTQHLVLSEDITLGLRALCRREGATLFMALTAGFSALLSRYTDEEDIVIGSPIANRNRPEVENLLGCFMNPLPLRIDLSGRPSFSELLRRVRDVCVRVYEHQDVPFDLLVRTLQPKRDPRNAPLFDVMLLLQNYPWQPVSLSTGQADEQLETDDVTERLDRFSYEMTHADLVYPVAIEAYERGPIVLCIFQYEAPFATLLTRAPEHFRRLIEHALVQPDCPIDDLRILTPEEEGRLQSQADAAAAPAAFVHRLFEEQAVRTPDALAVVSSDRRMTYGELNARSNQLAHHLKSLGVGPDVRVALLVNRSVEMITALLAVLKAGGAYVPLDPAYPVERLTFTLQDAKAAVILTTYALLSELTDFTPSQSSAAVVCLDRDGETLERLDRTNPDVPVEGANLAYVIYTSGSTGVPKGVQITHAALANYTDVAADAFGVDASDRVLQFASISFDTAAEEIYPCLSRGATLVLRTDEMIRSAALFLEKCEEWGITLLDLPTAYWHELSAEMARHDLDIPEPLRLVILGGERAHPDQVRRWQARFGGRVRLVNTYGPTESTIVATMYDIPPSVDALVGEIPIGKAVRNAHAYVLDRRLQLVPVGAPGELYLGGAGLARGYLDRPDLTATMFVPDPFTAVPGGRLYKTGDRARYLDDGMIEFLGRVDHQVKIRGYRIELSEIEAALMRHPAIEDTAVLLREEAPGKRLVAYCVAADGSVDGADLRGFLRDGLPDYMVPSAFVMLAAMPLTPNGKVDRDALPPPDLSGQLSVEYVAPQTGLQQRIVNVWQELLGVERVGLDDNFFDLGGHSLLVVKLHGRLRNIHPDAPSVVDLFKYSTVRALADHLTRNESEVRAAAAADDVRARADRQREAFRRRRQTAEAAVNVE